MRRAPTAKLLVATVGFCIPYRGAIGSLLVAVLTSACATSAPEVVPPRVPEQEGRYLSPPLRGYPLTVDSELSTAIRQAYDELMAGGDLAAVGARADQILALDSGFHPASVLRAQVDFLADDDLAVLQRLDPVADELPEYLACQLLRGRAAERRGQVTTAYSAFQRVAGRSELASRRSEDLFPRALEIVQLRLRDALDRGRIEDAESALAILQDWLGPDPRSLDAELQIAVAKGDLEQELAIVRQLAIDSDERQIQERWAVLELEIGDVRTGLEAFQQLVTEYPEDLQLADELDHAKFLWRLQLLPPHVQELGRKTELDRADFATLLYWLIPQVRLSTLDRPPIATDILDHPRRKEILPVTDLDLLWVDETLHRFDPSSAATRQMVYGAFLRLLDLADRQFSCLAPGELQAVRKSTSLLCAKAAQCRLIPEVADCLPSAPISGSEALELFRFEINLMGSDGT